MVPLPNKPCWNSVLGLVVLGAEFMEGLVYQGCALTTSGWTTLKDHWRSNWNSSIQSQMLLGIPTWYTGPQIMTFPLSWPWDHCSIDGFSLEYGTIAILEALLCPGSLWKEWVRKMAIHLITYTDQHTSRDFTWNQANSGWVHPSWDRGLTRKDGTVTLLPEVDPASSHKTYANHS